MSVCTVTGTGWYSDMSAYEITTSDYEMCITSSNYTAQLDYEIRGTCNFAIEVRFVFFFEWLWKCTVIVCFTKFAQLVAQSNALTAVPDRHAHCAFENVSAIASVLCLCINIIIALLPACFSYGRVLPFEINNLIWLYWCGNP